MKVTFKTEDGQELLQFVGNIVIGRNTHVVVGGSNVYDIVKTKPKLSRRYGFMEGVDVILAKPAATKEKEEGK